MKHAINCFQDPPPPLRCYWDTTILEVKQAIHELAGIPIERQSLAFCNHALNNNDASLSQVGVRDITEVELYEEIIPTAFQRPGTA